MPKVNMIFSACVFVALTSTMAAQLEREPAKVHKRVQDGITLDIRGEEGKKEDFPFETIELDEAAPSLIETGRICEDVAPEHTGFDVHGDEGFQKHASCEDLTQYCHNSSVGEQVRVSCPVSCFICMPGGGAAHHDIGPCFDAVNTGIRFRDGPKATCADLINYCNHTSIGSQVKEACKLSCGLCELHIEGPYLDAYGNCVDLQTHEEPQFTVSGSLAGCSDMAQFCNNHPSSYLIRHKCPLTCGVCGNNPPTTAKPSEADDLQIPGDVGGCDRRRRWGFCSTRRRRNV